MIREQERERHGPYDQGARGEDAGGSVIRELCEQGAGSEHTRGCVIKEQER